MFNNKSVVITTENKNIFSGQNYKTKLYNHHCESYWNYNNSKWKEKMLNYYNQIKNSPVFYGMNEEELKAILECFNARIKNYDDGEIIIRQGDMINNIYLVLEGNVNIEKDLGSYLLTHTLLSL